MMSNVHKAAQVIKLTDRRASPMDMARALDAAGLLTPAPQIIRTVEELEALDKMTVLMDSDEGYPLSLVWEWFDDDGTPWPDSQKDFPAVVVATGESVRAAREALEE